MANIAATMSRLRPSTTAGFAAFVNFYSPQALLPTLAHQFDVSASEISALITAATAAIALTAPFTGALADVARPASIIIAGLAVCAACGLLCQAVSTSYVITTAKEGRSSAVGLYASIFYIGGSAGGTASVRRSKAMRYYGRRGARKHAGPSA
jgi:MFS family permease